jgi:hypothetical protein
MAAPKGNKYWEFRGKHGRDFKYTPEALWDEAKLYFEWVEENPLWEEKGFAFQGIVTKERFAKMRAMTLQGFFLYADISHQTWENYKENKDFVEITTRIEGIIKSQKFEGAAADLLNPNIIARDLGLSDKQNIDHTTGGDKLSQFDPSKLTDEQLRTIAEIQRKAGIEP